METIKLRITLIITIYALILENSAIANTTWEFAGWYGGGCYTRILQAKNNYILSTDTTGVFILNKKNNKWVNISKGLTNINIAVLAFDEKNNILYAGTKIGIFKKHLNEKKWHYLKNTKTIRFERPYCYKSIYIDHQNGKLITGTKDGHIYISEDSGKNFIPFKKDNPFNKKTEITALTIFKGKLISASKEGISIFFDNKWQKQKEIKSAVYDIAVCNKTLFVACGKRIYFTKDLINWKKTKRIKKGIIFRFDVKNEKGKTIFIVAAKNKWNGLIYYSHDCGNTWKNISSKLHYDIKNNPSRSWKKGITWPTSIIFDKKEKNTFYFTDYWSVWKTNDKGKNWYEIINGAPICVGTYITSKDDKIFVSTMDQGIMLSKNSGKNYECIYPLKDTNYKYFGHIWHLKFIKKNTFLALLSSWKFKRNIILKFDLKDHKTTFLYKGLPKKHPKKNTIWHEGFSRKIISIKKELFIFIDGKEGGLFKSHDLGSSWQKIPTPLIENKIFKGICSYDHKEILLAEYNNTKKLFIYNPEKNKWKIINTPFYSTINLYTDSFGRIFACAKNNKPALYISTNAKKWEKIFTPPDGNEIFCVYTLKKNKNIIIASTIKWSDNTGSKVYITKDNGKTWKEITYNLPLSQGIVGFAENRKYLFALLFSGTVYRIEKKSL